jgi:hypothetical protein
MSDAKENDVKKKELTREVILRQVEETKKGINYTQTNIALLTQQLHQQQGILNFSEHLLAQFELPAEAKPVDPKKTELEVK